MIPLSHLFFDPGNQSRQITVLQIRAKDSAFLRRCAYMKTAPICQDKGIME